MFLDPIQSIKMVSLLTEEESECLLSSPAITPVSVNDATNFIVSSPYPDHLLDLTTIDEPSKGLAILLQELQPNEGYLDLPYDHAFNWSIVLSKLSPNFPATEFYIVVFRSRIAGSAVSPELLFELYTQDEKAHREANESGGLLKYWFGIPDFDGRNLATCVWTNMDWAMKASKLPEHVKGRALVWRGVYEHWLVQQYTLSVGGGKKWMIEKFQ
jgi:hypothetical protein